MKFIQSVNNDEILDNSKKMAAMQNVLYAILIGNSKICTYDNKKTLMLYVPFHKLMILRKYLAQHDLYLTFIESSDKDWYIIEPNFLLMRLVRDCVTGNRVTTVDSKRINSTVLLLWISLFAETSSNKETIINTQNLSPAVAHLIAKLYRNHIDTSYSAVFFKNMFYIEDIMNIFIYSIRCNRPLYESIELIRLFPNGYNSKRLYEFKLKAEGAY